MRGALLLSLAALCGAFAPQRGFKPQAALSTRRAAPAARGKVQMMSAVTEQGRALSEKLKGVPVYLVGMMGSGKSTVGNIFAKSLGSYSFVDTDATIEQLTGGSVADFFKENGEAEFRKLESAVLGQVMAFVRTVVSTGGGIVTVDENLSKMQSGIVVYLDVPPEVIAPRIIAADGRSGVRPLLADLDDPADPGQVAGKLGQLLEARQARYEAADVTVSLGAGDALDDCVLKIISGLEAFIGSNPPKWQQWKDKATLPAQ